MGLARNNAVILSEAAPAGAVGQDVMSVALYTAATGGTPLTGFDITTDPDPLELGQRYEIAVDALELVQEAGGGAELTTVDGAVAEGASTIVVAAVGNLSANEHFVVNGQSYSISNINAGTRTLTLNETVREAIANGASVQVALETHDATTRKLTGLVDGGLYVGYFSSLWAATNTGTLNGMSLARTSIPQASWTVT